MKYPIVTFNSVDHTGEIDEVLDMIQEHFKHVDREKLKSEILANEHHNVIISLIKEYFELMDYCVTHELDAKAQGIERLLVELDSPITFQHYMPDVPVPKW